MIVFEKEYDGNSIIDLPEDIYYSLQECSVPQGEYGLHLGSFKVTIEWVEK